MSFSMLENAYDTGVSGKGTVFFPLDWKNIRLSRKLPVQQSDSSVIADTEIAGYEMRQLENLSPEEAVRKMNSERSE